MMSPWSLRGTITLRLILLLLPALVQCQVDWRRLPYDNDDFNTDAKFDANVTLHCNDTTLTADFWFRYWIRPDTTVMRAGESGWFRILDGQAGWAVSVDGMELSVVAVQQRQFGLYLCVGDVVDNNGSILSTKVTKRGLNYAAPYFGDLWPVYRMNTIIGLSASGVFLTLFAIISVTYHFRYRNVDSDDEGNGGDNGEEEPEVAERNEALETVATSDGSSVQYRNPVYDTISTEL